MFFGDGLAPPSHNVRSTDEEACLQVLFLVLELFVIN